MINPEDTIEKVKDLARLHALQAFILARDSSSQIIEIEPHNTTWTIFNEKFPENFKESKDHDTSLDNIFLLAFSESISRLWAKHCKYSIEYFSDRYIRETKTKLN